MIQFEDRPIKNLNYSDVLIVNWDIDIIREIFNIDFNNYKPSMKNKIDNKFSFYTLVDEWSNKLVIDYDTIVTLNSNKTIYDDFIDFLVLALRSSKQQNTYELKYLEKQDIREFIQFKLDKDIKKGISQILSTHRPYKNNMEDNKLCADIFDKMIVNVPDRFKSIDTTKLVGLPFRKNDYFYKLISLSYLNLERSYLLKIKIL